jgi:hypothetical protein
VEQEQLIPDSKGNLDLVQVAAAALMSQTHLPVMVVTEFLAEAAERTMLRLGLMSVEMVVLD